MIILKINIIWYYQYQRQWYNLKIFIVGNHGPFNFLGPIDGSIPQEAKQEDSFINSIKRKVAVL